MVHSHKQQGTTLKEKKKRLLNLNFLVFSFAAATRDDPTRTWKFRENATVVSNTNVLRDHGRVNSGKCTLFSPARVC